MYIQYIYVFANLYRNCTLLNFTEINQLFVKIKKYLAIFIAQGIFVGLMILQPSQTARALLGIPVLISFQFALLLFLFDFEKLRTFTWQTAKENLDLKLVQEAEKKKRIKEMLKMGAINIK